MNKKSKLTEDEKQLFRDSMQGVTPLNHTKRSRKSIQKQQLTSPSISQATDYCDLPPLPIIRSNQPLSGNDILHFARSGVQTKQLRKLRQGKIPIEATLDLHRMTTAEAYHTVMHFIDRCQRQGIRWVCMVHGKGYHSGERPVIKNALNQWLRENKNVLAFHSAKPKHGGTGAIYVLLKII